MKFTEHWLFHTNTGASVVDVDTEETLFTTVNGSLAIPAGIVTDGSIIELWAAGRLAVPGSAVGLTLRLYADATLLAECLVNSGLSSQVFWNARCNLVASGADLLADGQAQARASGTSQSVLPRSFGYLASTAFDYAAGFTLDLTAQFDNTSGHTINLQAAKAIMLRA